MDYWTPGQSPVYHPDGAVIRHPESGAYYVREAGSWRLMTVDEVAAYEGSL
jgi:hypothetical protein